MEVTGSMMTEVVREAGSSYSVAFGAGPIQAGVGGEVTASWTSECAFTDQQLFALCQTLLRKEMIAAWSGMFTVQKDLAGGGCSVELSGTVVDGEDRAGRYTVGQTCASAVGERFHAVAYHSVDNVVIFGKSMGARQNSPEVVHPVAIFRLSPETTTAETPRAVLPLDVPGLDELLFPGVASAYRGFAVPDTGAIVQRTIVIKGAPGTGKSVLATQIMMGLARHGTYRSAYVTTREDDHALRHTAVSFDMCCRNASKYGGSIPDNEKLFDEWRKSGLIREVPIGERYYQFFTDQRFVDRHLAGCHAVFVDSLNTASLQECVQRHQPKERGREVLQKLFDMHRSANRVVFFLLEDYGEEATLEQRQLIADCEFLADAVIQLQEKSRHGYRTWALKVKKKHFGPQVYGDHTYKICPPGHALSNIFEHQRGIMVFPSIHKYLSGTREANEDWGQASYLHTGISHLDSIFVGDAWKRGLDGHSMPPDSTIVVRGPKGSHKLPVGINILLGGLWSPQHDSALGRDALIILLDEECDINIGSTAVATDTGALSEGDRAQGVGPLDNGWWLKPRGNDGCAKNRTECRWQRLCQPESNRGKKVVFRKVCFDVGPRRAEDKRECRKVVIAGFRPGCITPEEFLCIVKQLLVPEPGKGPQFSRVLFVSTAHLRMRFPLLEAEELFVPALVDLFKANRIPSVIIDTEGEGSNTRLSYGLSALADYQITLRPITDGLRERYLPYCDKVHEAQAPDGENPQELIRRLLGEYESPKEGYAWSLLDIENVRGKEYSKSTHAVTVQQEPGDENDWRNRLYIVNLRKVNHRVLRRSISGIAVNGVTSPVACLNISERGMLLESAGWEPAQTYPGVSLTHAGQTIGSVDLELCWKKHVVSTGKMHAGYRVTRGTISLPS